MTEICTHRGHYSYTAKKLVYRGLGNYDYVHFTVWSHHRKWKYAKNDVLCNKEYGYFVPMGKAEQLDLIVVRPIGDKA
jgi:hypothetical protein